LEQWPADFVARMSDWLGSDSEALFAAMAKRDIGIRLNPRRGVALNLAAMLPWATEPVPWCRDGLWLRAESIPGGALGLGSVGAHPYHTAGVYYLQDPSAMAAAVLLNPQPGEWVLDLAAAPGSKATHLAALMANEGVLVANEVSRRRATVLAMNLERMGVTHALVTNAYPDRLADAWAGLFDAMLVDAPCSGEATFGDDAQALRSWSLATIREYAARQGRILDQAASLVRRGGRILYGTCTFSPEENEGVIARFLDEHPEFSLVELPDLPGMGPGRPELIKASPELRKAGRFWPHTGPGHGHFYALLRRQGDPPDDLPARWEGQEMPGRILHLYERALSTVLTRDPPRAGLFLTKDDQCYITPMEPELAMRVPLLRPGWWVASVRHGKVQPDHALAMALTPEEVRAHIRLSPDDPRIIHFLDGGSWMDSGASEQLLVTVDGFPLGWAKRDAQRLRSRYPVHLRRTRALQLG
jgi:16S rRNA C967 or C1407 C5-methylase (RsmB/RsmF family)/NOL1/NOP2/fmu family ribosome biogenesis protein